MRVGLATKFLVPVCAWIIAATSILGWIVIQRQSKEYLDLILERGGSLVQFIAKDIWWGGGLAPTFEIEKIAQNAENWSDFLYLAVTNPQGNIITKIGDIDLERLGDIWISDASNPEEKKKIAQKIFSAPSTQQRIIDISCPVYYTSSTDNDEAALMFDQPSQTLPEGSGGKEELAGRVHIGLDLSPVDKQTTHFAKQTLLVGLLTILAGFVSMLSIVRILLGPLQDLRGATHRVASGDLNVSIPTTKTFRDELSELSASFNQMVLHLSEARTRIEEYNKGLENVIQKRTHEIQQLRDYLYNILYSIPSAVAIFNRIFEIEYANQEFQKNFQTLKDGHHPIIYSDSFQDQLNELFKERYSMGTEFRWDGKIFFYRLFRINNADRNQTGIVILDVTEERQLQNQLTQAEKLAGIGTLASGVAHEINNPLQGILGMAEAAMDEDELELIKEYTQDIITYAQQAGDIVRELSTYSRAARSDASMPLCVNTVIKSSLRMSQHANNYADVAINRDLQPVANVFANAGEMQQVFVNLFNNAVQAMNERGSLTIKTWEDDERVWASVQDTGCGIAKENLQNIFDPFFTTKAPGKGTGLGLNVAYRIIQKFGGAITVESQKGEGALFTIELPKASQTDDENTAN